MYGRAVAQGADCLLREHPFCAMCGRFCRQVPTPCRPYPPAPRGPCCFGIENNWQALCKFCRHDPASSGGARRHHWRAMTRTDVHRTSRILGVGCDGSKWGLEPNSQGGWVDDDARRSFSAPGVVCPRMRRNCGISWTRNREAIFRVRRPYCAYCEEYARPHRGTDALPSRAITISASGAVKRNLK